MVPRATLIAVLVGIEAALLVSMIAAIRGVDPWHAWSAQAATAQRQNGTYHFHAGASTAVTIAIGEADLAVDAVPSATEVTVVLGEHGFSFGRLAPLSATEVNGVVQITSSDRYGTGFIGVDKRLVHVTVPPNVRVTVEHAGDITLAGLRTDTSVHSSNGFIEVRDFRGDLTASSSDGHITIADATCGSLNVSSSDGRLTLDRIRAARITATSGDGRVTGTALVLRDGTISSADGNVSLGFARDADAVIDARVNDGRVRAYGFTAAGANAADANDDGDGPAGKTVRVGAGSGRLDVHAEDGNIDLTQEG